MTRLTLLLTAAALVLQADPRHDFEMQVRPLLAKNCWSCHRQTALGGLRLDSREAILKGGKSGPAIVEGKAAESLLVKAVTHEHDRLKMPPSGKLGDVEVRILTSWIDGGAYWPPEDKAAGKEKAEYTITPEQRAFWSFQPVKRPEVPDVQDGGWSKGPLDRFIHARLAKEGLQPVGPADKRTLIRRATFDLTGLPPTRDEVESFESDSTPEAFAQVVDRLLASPHYGERWGRFWLDVARYSDDQFNSTKEEPYPNSWRYRNWVIKAFNEDMPYDRFVRAQIAGDSIGEPAGTGFYAMSPEMQDDRVDATTRGFLGLTVACATCHDHKFDPIPTKDYYALLGVFSSTKKHELPLADKDIVAAWDKQKKELDDRQEKLNRFYEKQRDLLGEVLASKTARYLLATRDPNAAEGLDEETLKRWKAYLGKGAFDHPFLKPWLKASLEKPDASPEKLEAAAEEVQRTVLAVIDEKNALDKRNEIVLGVNPERDRIANATLESLERSKYIFWRNLFAASTKDSAGFFKSEDGIYYYSKGTIERFLEGPWRAYADEQKAQVAALKKELPEKYAFLHTIQDKPKPADIKVQIRGDRNNPGEIAPRRFLAILSPETPKPFTKGSGRDELADAIADPANPLTARVIVNRVWQHHFGRGIVDTPSNFGQLGARPTHPELLDYLASDFIEKGWSLKKLHRQILLSSTYGLSTGSNEANMAKDPANVFLWRANRQRLDAEALRDSMLFVSGMLDKEPGETAVKLDEKNYKRTVYGFISRRKLDSMLALFDFPNPNSTSESRMTTNVPLQRLYFMNSSFVEQQAKALADRFAGETDSRIRAMYQAVFGRDPKPAELAAGQEYIAASDDWPSYARVLLSSNEFVFTD